MAELIFVGFSSALLSNPQPLVYDLTILTCYSVPTTHLKTDGSSSTVQFKKLLALLLSLLVQPLASRIM